VQRGRNAIVERHLADFVEIITQLVDALEHQLTFIFGELEPGDARRVIDIVCGDRGL
jgi:hypothetical protein